MNNKQKLKDINRAIVCLTSDIRDMQIEKSELRQKSLLLRAEIDGLVPGETILRSTRRAGPLGQFQGYYSKFGSSSRWANVLLVNKDGKVGKRKTIFYDWEKVES